MSGIIESSLVEVSTNRQRKTFDPGKIMELMNSCSNPEIGLLQPIILREGKFLVAGERRLRMVRDAADLGIIVFHAGKPLPAGTIPYIDIGEMDPLAAWEAELEENIRRVDLSWQESARATAELLEMRKVKADRNGTPAPRIDDIVKELRGPEYTGGRARTEVKAEIQVAPHLNDPEVAAAPNLEKALKILKRREDRARNETWAKVNGRSVKGDTQTLINGDAREWIKGQLDSTYAVILTDPPYGMGADTFGDRGGRTAGAHDYEDSEESFSEILDWFPAETFRVAQENAHLYMFCDITSFAEIKSRMSDAGWRVFRTPLIWHKPSGFLTPWVDQGPQRRYETFLYAMKGKRNVMKISGDVISVSSDENLGHGAQKPVELFRELLSRSALPGDHVLDLFCGTGPIFPAAKATNCIATGIELNPEFYAIAAKRISELK